jgi:hypothetical protein
MFRGDIVPLVDADDRIWLAARCAAEWFLCYDVIDRTDASSAIGRRRVAGFERMPCTRR